MTKCYFVVLQNIDPTTGELLNDGRIFKMGGFEYFIDNPYKPNQYIGLTDDPNVEIQGEPFISLVPSGYLVVEFNPKKNKVSLHSSNDSFKKIVFKNADFSEPPYGFTGFSTTNMAIFSGCDRLMEEPPDCDEISARIDIAQDIINNFREVNSSTLNNQNYWDKLTNIQDALESINSKINTDYNPYEYNNNELKTDLARLQNKIDRLTDILDSYKYNPYEFKDGKLDNELTDIRNSIDELDIEISKKLVPDALNPYTYDNNRLSKDLDNLRQSIDEVSNININPYEYNNNILETQLSALTRMIENLDIDLKNLDEYVPNPYSYDNNQLMDELYNLRELVQDISADYNLLLKKMDNPYAYNNNELTNKLTELKGKIVTIRPKLNELKTQYETNIIAEYNKFAEYDAKLESRIDALENLDIETYDDTDISSRVKTMELIAHRHKLKKMENKYEEEYEPYKGEDDISFDPIVTLFIIIIILILGSYILKNRPNNNYLLYNEFRR